MQDCPTPTDFKALQLVSVTQKKTSYSSTKYKNTRAEWYLASVQFCLLRVYFKLAITATTLTFKKLNKNKKKTNDFWLKLD